MPSRPQRSPKAWLIGSGIEPLAAAFYIIQQGKIPGQQIRVLDTSSQAQAEGKECKDLVGDKLFNEESPSLCQDRCLLKLFSEIRGNLWNDDRYASKHRQDHHVPVPHTPAYPTEIVVNANCRLRVQSETHHFRPRNQKKIIDFMLQNESNFAENTIENVFDDCFFDSDIWELFSSK
jgi:myosin-crossreactive antigen